MSTELTRVQSAGTPIAVERCIVARDLMPDGTVLSLRDDRGWLNVWLGDEPLVDEPFEHGGPAWGMGQRSFAVSPDRLRVAFTRNEGGFGRLCVVEIESRRVSEVARGVHGQLSWQGGRVAALRSGARTPTQVVVYDDRTWERTVVAVGPLSGWEDLPLSEPELVEVAAADGSTLHARSTSTDACSAFSPVAFSADSVTCRDRGLERQGPRRNAGALRPGQLVVRTDGRARRDPG